MAAVREIVEVPARLRLGGNSLMLLPPKPRPHGFPTRECQEPVYALARFRPLPVVWVGAVRCGEGNRLCVAEELEKSAAGERCCRGAATSIASWSNTPRAAVSGVCQWPTCRATVAVSQQAAGASGEDKKRSNVVRLTGAWSAFIHASRRPVLPPRTPYMVWKGVETADTRAQAGFGDGQLWGNSSRGKSFGRALG